jgi:hypothetical protein
MNYRQYSVRDSLSYYERAMRLESSRSVAAATVAN